MDEEERRALAALAAQVGGEETERRPPARGLVGRLRAVWNAKSGADIRRAVGLEARPEGEEETPPWPPVGTYIEDEDADALRAAARAVGGSREDAEARSEEPRKPGRSALMDELGRAAAAVGRDKDERPRRPELIGELPFEAQPDEAGQEAEEEAQEDAAEEAVPRPAMSEGEKAFCIISPLPWIVDLVATLYLGRGGADVGTGSLILIAPIFLSYLMTGLGALLIVLARRKGRAVLALWAATLLAASVFLWWLISIFGLLIGRSWLVSLGLL